MNDPMFKFARDLASRIDRIERTLRSHGRASQAAYRGVHLSDTAVGYYDGDGALIGETTDEDGAAVLRSKAVNPPPQPTPPTCNGVNGGIKVVYDGTFVTDNWNTSIESVEVHALATATETPTDVTQIHAFTSSSGGSYMYPISSTVGTRYIVLVAVGYGGIEGPKSDAVPATPQPAANIEDGSITSAKLAGGATDPQTRLHIKRNNKSSGPMVAGTPKQVHVDFVVEFTEIPDVAVSLRNIANPHLFACSYANVDKFGFDIWFYREVGTDAFDVTWIATDL